MPSISPTNQENTSQQAALANLIDLTNQRVMTDREQEGKFPYEAVGAVRQMPANLLWVIPDSASDAMRVLIANSAGKPEDTKYQELEKAARYLKWYDSHQHKLTGNRDKDIVTINTKDFSLEGTIGSFDGNVGGRDNPAANKWNEQPQNMSWDATAYSHLALVAEYKKAASALPPERKADLDAIMPADKLNKSALASFHLVQTLSDPKDGMTIQSPRNPVKSIINNIKGQHALRETATEVFTDAKDLAARETAFKMANNIAKGLPEFEQPIDPKKPDGKKFFAAFKQDAAFFPYIDPHVDVNSVKDTKGDPVKPADVKAHIVYQEQAQLWAAATLKSNPKIIDQMIADGVIAKKKDGTLEITKGGKLAADGRLNDGQGGFEDSAYNFAKYPLALVRMAVDKSGNEDQAKYWDKKHAEQSSKMNTSGIALIDMNLDSMVLIGIDKFIPHVPAIKLP